MLDSPEFTVQDVVRAPPSRLAAVAVLTSGRPREGLIAIRRVLFVVRYDEAAGSHSPGTRLAGYGARRIAWGVRCGGSEDCRFDQNADLVPGPRARRGRINSRQRAIVRTIRRLKKEIDSRQNGTSTAISAHIRLPEFWAGFQPRDVDRVTGDGPELAGEVHTTGCSAKELMRDRCREHYGLTLFPLSWVSHHWERFRAVLIDLADFPKYQVYQLSDPAAELCGFRGACEFDFFHNRHRTVECRRNRSKPSLHA